MNRDIIYKELVQLDLEAESTDEVFSILAEKCLVSRKQMQEKAI